MLKVRDVYDFLDTLSPFEFAEEWDNSGLNVGSFDSAINKIFISLDIDEEVLNQVENDSLIITHHPLIFKSIDRFDYSLYPVNFIRSMIKRNISHIAMHTNYDKTHLNSYVAKDVLGFKNISNQEDFIIECRVDMELDELINLVKDRLSLKTIRVVNPKKSIKTLSLTTGSGGDLIPKIRSDVYLTGDIKYHQAMLAKANDLMLIDIAHYESEIHFARSLYKELKNFQQKAIIIDQKNPFKNY